MEIIAVCSNIDTKHINALCRQEAEFINFKPVYAYPLCFKAEEYCDENVWERQIFLTPALIGDECAT